MPYTNSFEEAKELCRTCDVQVERRQRKKKKMPEETAKDIWLIAENEMLRLMESMTDKMQTNGRLIHQLKETGL